MPDGILGQSDDTAPSRLQCPHCGKTYLRSSHLRRHQATHTSNGTVSCPRCSKLFTRRDVARRHLQSCNSEAGKYVLQPAKRGKKPRACDKCSRDKVSCDSSKPCSRCSTRGAHCSYLRIDASATLPNLEVSSPLKDISWLLGMTDPSCFGTPENVAKGIYGDDPAEHPLELPDTALPKSSTANSFSSEDGVVWGSGPWLLSLDSSFSLGFDECPVDLGLPISSSPVLESRMEQLIAQLAETTQTMNASSTNASSFDRSLARSVFTPSNTEFFVWVYFQRIHAYHPIIHSTTFHTETASLPLLLVVFLYGALLSAPIDYALSARCFFDVAEEYIFNHPNMQRMLYQVARTDNTNDDIEILQAALSIVVIQNSKNDPSTRRRLQFNRLPQLNAAIRLSGVLSATRSLRATDDGQIDWHVFIEEELKIRLAHWTQTANTFIICFFNGNSHIHMSEMTGDLPCREEVFEAETAEDFRARLLPDLSRSPPPALATIMSELLRDNDSKANEDLLKCISRDGLFIVICALSRIIWSAKANCIFAAMYYVLSRACSRWKGLWDQVATNGNHSTENVVPSGFVKHTLELWRVNMIYLKVMRSGDISSHFMKTTALDSFDSVHDFLKQYKDI